MRGLWVARLDVSHATAQKIINMHGLSEQEVRDAVECVAGLSFVWDDDLERGRRAIVETFIRGDRTLVVLYPAGVLLDEDVYNLGSAYRVSF